MINKFATVGALCILSFTLSGCLSDSETNFVGDDLATTPPVGSGGGDSGGGDSGGGDTGGGGSGGGGSGGGGSGGGGDTPPPPPPPVDTLDTIPDVPFDYKRVPGAITTSGSLPTTINAGTVLDFTGQTISQDMSMNCQGTEADPAFIVGGTLMGASDIFMITGSWCYFVDTKFVRVQPRPTGDHMVFRNVEIRDLQKNGMNIYGSNIVLTESEIHHNQPSGRDAHGIQVAQGAVDVWILANIGHHNSGDSLQGCHGCTANPPRNVYIGGNTFYSDRENAVDFKWIENVIVEGNVFYGYLSARPDTEWCFDDGSSCGTWNSGSDGSAVVIGSDGTPNGVVIKDNEIYDSINAVRVEEGVGIQIINNNMTNITSRCLQLDKDGENMLFQENTCTNADRGIFQNWRDNFSLTVDNNVFNNLSGPAIEYESRNVCDASTLTSNQFTATGSIICGNTVATDTAGVNALPGASGNMVN